MKIQFIVCGWWYDEWDGKKNQTEFIEHNLLNNKRNGNSKHEHEKRGASEKLYKHV